MNPKPSRRKLPHASRLAALTLAVGLTTLQACSFLHEQVALSTASDCIDRNCAHQEGAAREQCSTECANRYGK